VADIAMEVGSFRLTDVFSKTFAIYIRRFVPFIILTLIASVPNYLAILVIGSPTGGRPGDFNAGSGVLTLLDFATKSFVSGAVNMASFRTFAAGPFRSAIPCGSPLSRAD
jgi:hypothetical protein